MHEGVSAPDGANTENGEPLGADDAADRCSSPGAPSGASEIHPFGAQDIPGFGTVFNTLQLTPAGTKKMLEERSWETVSSLVAGAHSW